MQPPSVAAIPKVGGVDPQVDPAGSLCWRNSPAPNRKLCSYSQTVLVGDSRIAPLTSILAYREVGHGVGQDHGLEAPFGFGLALGFVELLRTAQELPSGVL